MAKKSSYKRYSHKGYGKRPLWQWILLYVIIGGIIYAVVYGVFFANKGMMYGRPTTNVPTTTSPTTAPGYATPVPLRTGY